MSQKVFKGEEYPDDSLVCDVVIVGDYADVLKEATDHVMLEHEIDPDSSLINQTIRDYNETADGPPHSCTHVS